jgi:hypothetical protein
MLARFLCLLGYHDSYPCELNARFDRCHRCGKRWRVA